MRPFLFSPALFRLVLFGFASGCTLVAGGGEPKTIGSIERLDPAFDKLVRRDARIEVLANGFDWSEGPVWVPKLKSLLFSDIPRNEIIAWHADKGIRVFRQRSGFTGKSRFAGREPGTNGLTLDSQGRLVMCCHGDRLVRRIEPDGTEAAE